MARRLWRTFTIASLHTCIPEVGRNEIEARANFISHSFRATRVRKLRVFIDGALGLSEFDPVAYPTIRAVGLAMRATNNVVTLDIRGPYHCTPLAEEISALPPSWAPDLRSITTSLSCGNALSSFWSSRRHVTELELLFGEDCTQPLIYSPLPHLTTMKVATPAQTFCVAQLHAPRGSPLESISIGSFRDVDAQSLGANLSHVFTSLTHLDISLHPSEGPSSVMYEKFISRFINLRRLRTDHPQLPREYATRAFAACRALKHLEEFEWNGIGTVSIQNDSWLIQSSYRTVIVFPIRMRCLGFSMHSFSTSTRVQMAHLPGAPVDRSGLSKVLHI